MQNKADLQVFQINVTYAKTKNYEQKTMEGKPIKQTQSNPIYGEPVEPPKPIFWTSAAKAYAEVAGLPVLRITNNSRERPFHKNTVIAAPPARRGFAITGIYLLLIEVSCIIAACVSLRQKDKGF
jgi:hypothetical protein